MDNVRKHEDAKQLFEVTNSYLERGKKEGLAAGIEQGMEMVAKEMVQNGFSIDQIMLVTKINRNKLEKLKRNHEAGE